MRLSSPSGRRADGFTLIELMIAVAVLAIIVGIAIPAYTNQVVKTNRTEGKTAILNAAQALERCYSRFNQYDDTANCPTANTVSGAGITTQNEHYLITSTALTATTYTLQAAPQGSQATRDTECANLSITHTGQRAVSGSGEVTDCW